MTETEKIKSLIDTIIKDTESVVYKVGIETDYLTIKKQGVSLIVSLSKEGISYDIKGENLTNLIATSQLCQIDKHKVELQQFYELVDRTNLVPDYFVGDMYKVSSPSEWHDFEIIKILKINSEKEIISYVSIYKTVRGMWNEGIIAHKISVQDFKQALLDGNLTKTSI